MTEEEIYLLSAIHYYYIQQLDDYTNEDLDKANEAMYVCRDWFFNYHYDNRTSEPMIIEKPTKWPVYEPKDENELIVIEWMIALEHSIGNNTDMYETFDRRIEHWVRTGDVVLAKLSAT